MTRHTDYEDDYPEGIAAINDNLRIRTAFENLALIVATLVASAGILYGLALIAQGLINIFQIFGRIA